LYRKCIKVYFIYFLLLLSPFLSVTRFFSCSSLFWYLFVVQWDFCLGVIPIMYCAWVNITLLHCTSLPFPPILCQQFSVCFLVSCSYTDVMYFIIHHLSFFLFLPWCPLSVPLLGTCYVYVPIIYNIACFCIELYSTYERKTYALWPSKPGKLHLR
jgi:hypothetical protein